MLELAIDTFFVKELTPLLERTPAQEKVLRLVVGQLMLIIVVAAFSASAETAGLHCILIVRPACHAPRYYLISNVREPSPTFSTDLYTSGYSASSFLLSTLFLPADAL